MRRPGRGPAHRVTRGALVVAAGLGLAACGSVVERGELEARIVETFETSVGVTPAVSCPRDLDAEVGATVECTATDPDGGAQSRLRVTVTAVDGDQAEFDIEPEA